MSAKSVLPISLLSCLVPNSVDADTGFVLSRSALSMYGEQELTELKLTEYWVSEKLDGITGVMDGG